jgi:adenylate kinase family enzyme
MTTTEKKIVCLSGLGGSGKTTLVKHAVENLNLTPFSPAALMRDFDPDFTHADRTASRDTLRRMRTVLGADIIVRTALELPDTQLCFDGPRCVCDLDLLQATPGVKTLVIGLDAPDELRHQRALAEATRRGRDPVDCDAFLAQELPEHRNPDRQLPSVLDVMARADHIIVNDGQMTLEGLVAAFDSCVIPFLQT